MPVLGTVEAILEYDIGCGWVCAGAGAGVGTTVGVGVGAGAVVVAVVANAAAVVVVGVVVVGGIIVFVVPVSFDLACSLVATV